MRTAMRQIRENAHKKNVDSMMEFTRQFNASRDTKLNSSDVESAWGDHDRLG
jgi:hypothetical protein